MKKQLQKLANDILKREAIIQNPTSLDKDVQDAMQEIQDIIFSLSYEDLLQLDDFIFKKILTY